MHGGGAWIRVAAAAALSALFGTAALDGTPQAAPSAFPAAGEAPLTVTFTPGDPDGAYYQWQFDAKPGGAFAADYASETADPVTFTYTAAGSYTAVLRVHDALTGEAADHALRIDVHPPPRPPGVTLTASHALVLAGTPVTFTASAAASPGRTLAAYLWDTDGDGRDDENRPPGPSSEIVRGFEHAGTYPVTVTAVDDHGLAGSATTTLTVRRPPDVSFPESEPDVAVVGEPFTFQAEALVHPPGTLASWHWDFGDGATSASAPPVARTYATAEGRSVTVTVTDSLGLSTSRSRSILVVTRPKLVLRSSSSEFRVWAFPPLGTTVVLYEWDFGADGTVDATSPGGFSAAVAPATGTLRVLARLSDGAVLTETWSAVFKRSPHKPVPLTPVVALRASESGAYVDATSDLTPAPLQVRVGRVVRFSAAASVRSTDDRNVIHSLLWDFEGDGLRDQTDALHSLGRQTVSGIEAEFQAQNVGRTTVVVSALESGGGSARASVLLDVLPGTGALETWISQPRPGQRVWGDRVSVQARATPANRVGRVHFEVRPAAGGPWRRIGTAVPPPYTSLGIAWNVTRMAPGDYDLRALAVAADGLETADSENLLPVRVRVDPSAPEVLEFGTAGAPIVRVHSLDPATSNRTEISGDTAIEFPPAAFGARATVRMERPASNPHPLEARQQNLHFVPGSFRRLHLDGQTLEKPSRIALYDLNPDGVLDALAVDKSRLRIFQFDPGRRQWVPLFSQVVQPNEDLVRATFVSMGDVGLVVDRAPAGGGGDDGGGCGMIGLELLVLALLLRSKPPRPRSAE